MSKFYAVKVGRRVGIFRTWAECQEQVVKFQGAEFKSFKFEADAKNYMEGVQMVETGNIEIYTDGSHYGDFLGIGAFCRYKGKEYKLSQRIVCDKISNPTCEFLAFEACLKYLKDIPSTETVTFFIDYIGVKHWMSGEWKCKAKHIKLIKKKCDEILKDIKCKITIEHVPAHSGVFGNEMADKLAKSQEEINTFTMLQL